MKPTSSFVVCAGIALTPGESEMSDMPIEFGVAFSNGEAVRFSA